MHSLPLGPVHGLHAVGRLTDGAFDDETRAFLQHRVTAWAKTALALVAGHHILTGLLQIAGGAGPSALLDAPGLAHFGACAVLSVTWLVLVVARYPPSILGFIESASTLLLVAALAAVGVVGGPSGPHAAVGLVGGSLAIVARAVIVPSTGDRTLHVSALGAVVIVAAEALGQLLQSAGTAFDIVPVAMRSSWVVVAVALAYITSSILYGLRQQVRRSQILGGYEVEREIGQGGMGVIHRARHRTLGRPAAIKVLRPGPLSPRMLLRFQNEVRAAASLQHPNIVTVYDFDYTEDGVFFCAMELIEGIDLATLVDRTGPLETPRVAHILIQLCSALAEAHEAGLVHRDIKPANVMVCDRGGVRDLVKVLDFGLVKLRAGASTEPDPGSARSVQPLGSRTEAVIGTPMFMAPEAILGRGIDHRADLYGVGAVGHFLLTGKTLFPAGTRDEVLSRQVKETPPPPSQVLGRQIAPEIEDVIMECLSKEAGDRPSSAEAVVARLRTHLQKCPWDGVAPPLGAYSLAPAAPDAVTISVTRSTAPLPLVRQR